MKQIEKIPLPIRAAVRCGVIKAIATSQHITFKCNVYFEHELHLFGLQMTWSCNTISLAPSHSHTHTGSYIRWRLVHMSYIHAEIDRYNCMHMQSCSFSLIWRHSGVKDFFQSKGVLTRGTSLSSVMKTICKLFELKVKELREHLGADCRRVFLPLRNFFSHYRHEKIISGELNLCQRGSGK